METQEAAHASCLAPIVRNAVGDQPVFAQPDIEEKDHDESAQIEDVLFDRDGMSQGGGENPECRAAVGKTEEPAGKNKVEQEANRGQNADSAPEGSLWNLQALARQKPDCNHENRDDEQRQTPSVGVPAGVGGRGNELAWKLNAVQGDGGGGDNHH